MVLLMNLNELPGVWKRGVVKWPNVEGTRERTVSRGIVGSGGQYQAKGQEGYKGPFRE